MTGLWGFGEFSCRAPISRKAAQLNEPGILRFMTLIIY